MIRLVLLGLIFAFAFVAIFMRYASFDVKSLHVDPETVEKPGVGHALVRSTSKPKAPIYNIPAALLAERIQLYMTSKARTAFLTGSQDNRHLTYITRSAIFAFPDALTVKVIDLGAGQSTVAVFSRQLYGVLDFGVNKVAVDDLLENLKNDQG